MLKMRMVEGFNAIWKNPIMAAVRSSVRHAWIRAITTIRKERKRKNTNRADKEDGQQDTFFQIQQQVIVYSSGREWNSR
jgi:hypothetical protein